MSISLLKFFLAVDNTITVCILYQRICTESYLVTVVQTISVCIGNKRICSIFINLITVRQAVIIAVVYVRISIVKKLFKVSQTVLIKVFIAVIHAIFIGISLCRVGICAEYFIIIVKPITVRVCIVRIAAEIFLNAVRQTIAISIGKLRPVIKILKEIRQTVLVFIFHILPLIFWDIQRLGNSTNKFCGICTVVSIDIRAIQDNAVCNNHNIV